MDLLLELINISTQDDLLEDLGSLKQIDKTLVKSLFTSTGWGEGRRDFIRGELGRDAVISEVSAVKNAAAAWKILDESVAIVVMLNGKQAMILVRWKGDKGTVYRAGATPALLDLISAQELEDTYPSKKRWQDAPFKRIFEPKGESTATTGDIKRLITTVFERAKERKIEIKLLTVNKDTQRRAKNSERENVRRGMIPLPTGGSMMVGGKKKTYVELTSHYFKSLKQDLHSRLEKYKASKAKSVSSPEELLNDIVENGYLEKIKVMGYTYSLYDSRIQGSIINGKKPDWHGESYVEYKIQGGTPEYNKLMADVEELRNKKLALAGNDKEARDKMWEEYYTERKKIAPPGKFKVILSMKGGTIVPSAIKFEEDYFAL